MLNARYSENTFLTIPAPVVALRIVKDENEVKRVVPYLQPVATVITGGTGPYRGRPKACIYSLPDGELIRLRLKGDNTYDYDNATVIPKTHSAYQEYKKNTNVSIDLLPSQDRERGPLANKRDINWLKDTIEAQLVRARQELSAEGPRL